MKKILLTWANWMLAHDFIKENNTKFEIIWFDKDELDITNLKSIKEKIEKIKPNIILNFAAYTQVDDAEDMWKKLNFDINALWVYNLAKNAKKYKIDFITISSDYVFDWTNLVWYNEESLTNPINEYGMSKYLWEYLAKSEYKDTIIIRTSWLYGWWKDYKNFVNTMLSLWQTKKELKVVNDQFWNPTNAKDLSIAISKLIGNIDLYRWKILHFSNETPLNWITWFDFAKEIFKETKTNIKLTPCNSEDFPVKAKRPKYSKLINNSWIKLRNWEEGLSNYLNNL